VLYSHAAAVGVDQGAGQGEAEAGGDAALDHHGVAEVAAGRGHLTAASGQADGAAAVAQGVVEQDADGFAEAAGVLPSEDGPPTQSLRPHLPRLIVDVDRLHWLDHTVNASRTPRLNRNCTFITEALTLLRSVHRRPPIDCDIRC